MAEQITSDLCAILAELRPRAFLPDGQMAERINRRLRVSLSRLDDPRAETILAALAERRPDVTLWADDATRPHVSVSVRNADGSATVWQLSMDAAGVAFTGDQFVYWPDPELDGDIPAVPVALGVDAWCVDRPWERPAERRAER